MIHTGTYERDQVTFRNGPAVSIVGAIVISISVLLVLSYVACCFFDKWRRSRKTMDPCAAGMFRLAAAQNNIGKLELISRVPNFDINAGIQGFTAVHAAAAQGHTEALQWLCKHDADVNLVKDDKWRDTALHYAAARGDVKPVKVLLAAGANAAAKNYAGATPADVATKKGDLHMAKYLTAVTKGLEPKPTRATAIDHVYLPWTYEGEAEDIARAATRALQADLMDSDDDDASSTSSMEGFPVRRCIPCRGKAAKTLPRKEQPVPDPFWIGSDHSGRVSSSGIRHVLKLGGAAMDMALEAATARGFYGCGSQGTELKATALGFRRLAVATVVATVVYLVWRALRSLAPGYGYFYSIPVWLCEFLNFGMSSIFTLSLWSQIERPVRVLGDMLPEEKFPHVDVYICCYSEPLEVIEPTAIAALNLSYPGSKLHVHILDDGKDESVKSMVQRINCQIRYMKRQAELIYIARDKVKGVPHHAKAGNINSALLKEAPGKGEFILVLDCDMLAHPDLLLRVLGHFYEHNGKAWIKKEKAAFVQTPQDFWNVDAHDPMAHCARFFYGPMLQGRDGIGACPCCGTGVVFQRDVLISIGGQAYGSVTEDYNTAMALLSAGFATMFLNERLCFGMAPDDVVGLFRQRLRWSMGALQILIKNNPLRLRGLTTAQAFLFFESASCSVTAISIIALAFIPIIYVFAEYSPLVAPRMYEFTATFGTYYLLNRLMIWWAHRGCEGANQELWRGSQMSVWLAPNNLLAICKVIKAEFWIFKWLFSKEVGFAVTNKEKQGTSRWSEFRKGLRMTWPFLLYIALFAAAVLYFIIRAALGNYTLWRGSLVVAALGWAVLVLLCIWPPVGLLLPKIETEEGWKVMWDAILHVPEEDAAARGAKSRRNSVESTSTVGRSLEHFPRARRFSPPIFDRSRLRPPAQRLSRPEAFSPRGSLEEYGHKLPIDLPAGYLPEAATDGTIPALQASSSQVSMREPHPHALFTGLPEVDRAIQLPAEQLSANSLDERTTGDFPPDSLPAEEQCPARVDAVTITRTVSQQDRQPSLAEKRQHLTASEMAQEAHAHTGSIGLPAYRDAMLQQSSLLTSFVLPERAHLNSQLHLLLREDGSFAPAPKEVALQQLPVATAGGKSILVVVDPEDTAEKSGISAPHDASGQGGQAGLKEGHQVQLQSSGSGTLQSQQPAALERWGDALVVPTEPASIYEHGIGARPNFQNRAGPAANYCFVLVNGLLIIAAIVGSVWDYFARPHLPVLGHQ